MEVDIIGADLSLCVCVCCLYVCVMTDTLKNLLDYVQWRAFSPQRYLCPHKSVTAANCSHHTSPTTHDTHICSHSSRHLFKGIIVFSIRYFQMFIFFKIKTSSSGVSASWQPLLTSYGPLILPSKVLPSWFHSCISLLHT